MTSTYDTLPKAERLPQLLTDYISKCPGDDPIMELCKELGYGNSVSVKLWMSGRSKVPMRAVSGICDFLGLYIEDVLPLWMAQHYPDAEEACDALQRRISADEFRLVELAREVYRLK